MIIDVWTSIIQECVLKILQYNVIIELIWLKILYAAVLVFAQDNLESCLTALNRYDDVYKTSVL